MRDKSPSPPELGLACLNLRDSRIAKEAVRRRRYWRTCSEYSFDVFGAFILSKIYEKESYYEILLQGSGRCFKRSAIG